MNQNINKNHCNRILKMKIYLNVSVVPSIKSEKEMVSDGSINLRTIFLGEPSPAFFKRAFFAANPSLDIAKKGRA